MAKKAAPRRVVQGDRSPVLTTAGIEQFEIGRATEAARLAKVSAIRDVLRTADKDELESVAMWLQAVLAAVAASGTPASGSDCAAAGNATRHDKITSARFTLRPFRRAPRAPPG